MEAFAHLQALYFLEHLPPEQLELLAGICRRQRFVSGDDILKQGEQTTHFYIVDEGHVNLRHTDRGGFEKPVGSKGPGEYFGVKMFTTEEPSDYTFEAVDAAVLWVIARTDWDKLIEAHPELMENLPELRAEYDRLTHGLEWLSPGEVIVLETRRHWWALILMMRVPLVLALVLTIAFAIAYAFGATKTLPEVMYTYGAVMFVFVLWAVFRGLSWYEDMYIVTNKRVVSINRVFLSSDSRQDLAIDKIQSEKVNRGGPISVFLNISDLHITSSASDTAGVLFQEVGNVGRIQQAIENERLHVAERKRAMERERLRRQISGEIKHYVLAQPPAPEPKAAQAAAAKPTVTKAAVSAPGRSPLRLPTLWRPRPKAVSAPVPFGKRLQELWHTLLATEIRVGSTVTWRKHHWVLFRQIFPGIAAFVVCVILLVIFVMGGVPPDLIDKGLFAVLLLAMAGAIGYIAWQWEDWRVDLYRLSDSEIVDIESLPFGLNYQEKKAELKNIQDVTVSRLHLGNVFLDFGNVDSRVGGGAGPFRFNDVPHPQFVADEITERIERLKLRGTESVNREQTRSIVDAIVAYHRLLMTERHQNAPDASAPSPSDVAPTTAETPQTTPPAPALNPPFTSLVSDETPGVHQMIADGADEFPSEADL